MNKTLKLFFISLIPNKKMRKRLRKKLKNSINPLLILGDNVMISNPEKIEITGSVYIGADCKIYSQGGISLGKHIAIGEGTLIMTEEHNYNSTISVPMDNVAFQRKVEIGDNVWIGLRTVIMSGVKIEEGAVIGSCSVVTKSVPKCAIVAGNPAKIINYRDPELYEKLSKMDEAEYLKLPRETKVVTIDEFKPFIVKEKR